MENKKYSTKKKWYDKELKTHQGEVIVRRGDNSFKVVNYPSGTGRFWVDEETRLFLKNNSHISNRDVEIFISFLYNMLGLETIHVRPAHVANLEMKEASLLSNKKEIINIFCNEAMLAEDFICNREKQEEVKSNDFLRYGGFKQSVEEHLKALQDKEKIKQVFKNIKVLKVAPNIEEKLRRLALLDFLTLQRDRGKHNLSYILTDKGDHHTLDLAPIFDNSMAFLNSTGDYKELFNWLKVGDTEKLFDFVKDVHFTFFFQYEKYNYPSEDLFFKTGAEYNAYNLQLKDAAEAIAENKELLLLFRKIQNFDLKNVLVEMKEQMPEYNFDPKLFNLIETLFNFNVQQLRNTLKNTKNMIPRKTARLL